MTETYDTCFLHLLFFDVSYIEHRKKWIISSATASCVQIFWTPKEVKQVLTPNWPCFKGANSLFFGIYRFWVQAYPWKWKYSCLFWAPKKKLDHITIVELRDAEDMMVSGALLATWILLGIRRSNSISGEPGPIPWKAQDRFFEFPNSGPPFPRSIF